MQTQKAKLILVLIIFMSLVALYAAVYFANRYIDRCDLGGFDRDSNGELQAYYICYKNGVEATRWYRSSSDIELAVTSEITP